MSVGGGEWAWLSPLSLLYFYCNLVCELLHVLTTPGHTTIFELALLFDVVRVSIYPKSFVCLLVCLFIPSFFWLFFKACNNTDNMPEVTTGSRGYKQARVKR